MSKIVGQNKGFKIEKIISGLVNDKLLDDIDLNYKILIKKYLIYLIVPIQLLNALKKEGHGLEKTDLIFELENQRINTSVKSGSANSVHQEKFDSFLDFLDSVKQLETSEKDLINEFHWCDGTIDNKGLVEDRKPKIYANIHPKRFDSYIKILRRYKKEIFLRTWVGSKILLII